MWTKPPSLSHLMWHTSLQSFRLHLSTPLTSSNGQRVLAQLAVALALSLTKFLPRSHWARPNTVRMQSSGNDGPLLSSFFLLNLPFNWIINGNWSTIRSNINCTASSPTKCTITLYSEKIVGTCSCGTACKSALSTKNIKVKKEWPWFQVCWLQCAAHFVCVHQLRRINGSSRVRVRSDSKLHQQIAIRTRVKMLWTFVERVCAN